MASQDHLGVYASVCIRIHSTRNCSHEPDAHRRSQILSLLASLTLRKHLCRASINPHARIQRFSRPPNKLAEQPLEAAVAAESQDLATRSVADCHGKDGDTLVVLRDTVSHEEVPFKEGERVRHTSRHEWG